MITSRGTTIFSYTVLILFTLLTLCPLYVMIAVAVMPSHGLASQLYHLWPTHAVWDNFVSMWSQLPLFQYLFNSLVIAGGATILALLTGVPAAYALSRTTIPGRRVWLFVFLATQLFSPSIIIVGAYRVLAVVNGTDTYWGLILLDSGFYCLPFVVWITAGFMRQIPAELDDAAAIDGASSFTKLWRVIIPIAFPAIVVAAVFAFIQGWNDFAFALTLATSTSVRPLPIGIYSFVGAYSIQWNYLMGASIVATIPILVLFLVMQRRLVGGLTAGAVK